MLSLNLNQPTISSIKRVLSIAQTSTAAVKLPKKIIVLESDDWGSIRAPKSELHKEFTDLGLDLFKNPFFRFDQLEEKKDIVGLLELMEDVENKLNRKPKITLNYVMANPDFQMIRESDFSQYVYKPFTQVYQEKYGNLETLEAVNQGISSGYFLPQFHGREHIQVAYWLELLQQKDPVYRKAFELGFWGIGKDDYPVVQRNVQASFDLKNTDELPFLSKSIQEGLDMFEEIFGFRSKSFIPNNYIWPDELNEVLVSKGVQFMQGMKYQKMPKKEFEKKRMMRGRKSGQPAKNGLMNLVRNTAMEFSLGANREKVLLDCLRDIKIAFFFNQPAVISIHRINFSGGIEPKNLEQNLNLLKQFFMKVHQNWPDAEFMNTVELGDYIKSIQKNEIH